MRADLRRRLGVLVAIGVALLAFAGASWGAGHAVPAHKPSAASSERVIVRAAPGSEARAIAAVRKAGGQIGLRLPIVHGFAARVPASSIESLRRLSFVVSVTKDASLEPQGTTYSPVSDEGSMYNTTLITGAQDMWKAGYTGKGVDVALIDSGVVGVDGLTVSGKVVNGADLSFESQASNLRYLDTFGHGTHMAGIIAGRANAAVSGKYAGDQTNFLGMAPDARVVSIKVADAHGATDVSQVIAAISWVVQHRKDNGLNIRVLNLSYGTNSTQAAALDPLSYAVEVAWKKGIVVVAAAGNAGYAMTGSLTNPATNPFVLAVGSVDTHGTTAMNDDTVSSFSSSSNWGANGSFRLVDLVAPGAHIVSLRDPGSYIDQKYGGTGAVTSKLFRGSGTSQSAAVVSGAAALVLQQRPDLTPDEVKRILTYSATLINAPAVSEGNGELNLKTALPWPTSFIKGFVQYLTPGTGKGTLEGSRGSNHLVKDSVSLSGEKDIFGKPFSSATMAALEANGSSWSGGVWNGSSWSGSSWSGSSWSGSSWSGSSWSSVTWAGSSWSGSSWSGSSWSSNNWLSSSWADSTWSSASWN